MNPDEQAPPPVVGGDERPERRPDIERSTVDELAIPLTYLAVDPEALFKGCLSSEQAATGAWMVVDHLTQKGWTLTPPAPSAPTPEPDGPKLCPCPNHEWNPITGRYRGEDSSHDVREAFKRGDPMVPVESLADLLPPAPTPVSDERRQISDDRWMLELAERWRKEADIADEAGNSQYVVRQLRECADAMVQAWRDEFHDGNLWAPAAAPSPTDGEREPMHFADHGVAGGFPHPASACGPAPAVEGAQPAKVWRCYLDPGEGRCSPEFPGGKACGWVEAVAPPGVLGDGS